ncbi:MAG TPA: hypothetical protein VFZ78_06085, partial [Flavisolibacter sp.]
MRKICFVLGFFCSALLATAQVDVTATGGTANASYTTLKAAVDAVNAGTHTGAITINITANTTETAISVLNGSGAGAASYTSILIRPTADGLTIAGPSAQGRGLIELNGADNVTIDGDNPNTPGINRNLTITNTISSTTTYASVIRIVAYTSVITSADNNTIKNLIINGHASGRNIATATSTTASENTSYAILAGARGTAVPATEETAPTAVSSISTLLGSGGTIGNLVITNNEVNRASRGIMAQGSATTVFPGLIISDNVVGNSAGGAADQIYAIGIAVNGTANGIVSGNTVYVEGYVASSASNQAIGIG